MNDNTDGRKKCTAKTEVWSRCCGFFRPTSQYNRGLLEQYHSRKVYDVQKAVETTPDPPHNGREDIQYDGRPKP